MGSLEIITAENQKESEKMVIFTLLTITNTLAHTEGVTEKSVIGNLTPFTKAGVKHAPSSVFFCARRSVSMVGWVGPFGGPSSCLTVVRSCSVDRPMHLTIVRSKDNFKQGNTMHPHTNPLRLQRLVENAMALSLAATYCFQNEEIHACLMDQISFNLNEIGLALEAGGMINEMVQA